MSITLVLGGTRSGKSAHAEHLATSLAKQHEKQVIYLATAPHINEDKAWEQRIAQHQARRPSDWIAIEETLNIAEVCASYNHQHVILVDCMTLWLSNLLWAETDSSDAIAHLSSMLQKVQADVILVSNELGMGLVPEDALSREFRDAQGKLNQTLAKLADHVMLVVAGLPLVLKGEKQ